MKYASFFIANSVAHFSSAIKKVLFGSSSYFIYQSGTIRKCCAAYGFVCCIGIECFLMVHLGGNGPYHLTKHDDGKRRVTLYYK